MRALNPLRPRGDVDDLLNHAEAAWARGDHVLLRDVVRDILHAWPTTEAQWVRLAHLLPVIAWEPADALWRPQVTHALGVRGVDADALVPLALHVLHEGGTGTRDPAPADLPGLAADPLLLRVLTQTVVADDAAEAWLTRLRALGLHLWTHERALVETSLPLWCALAMQATHNQHVHAVSPGEQSALGALGRALDQAPTAGTLAVAACYAPLRDHPRATAWTRLAWPDGLRAVLQAQVTDHALEQGIRARLGSHPGSGDRTSDKVRAQYEEHPYPRWLTLEAQAPDRLGRNLATWFPWFTPPPFLDASPAVLVAGCGTGRHVLLRASRYTHARYLAIDLSTASLAYAVRRAQELGIPNVDFQRADILAFPGTVPSFHAIECGGVLNCFSDPVAGWRRLRELLVPGGVMCVALYSHHARAVVREAWKSLGWPQVDVGTLDVRAARQAIRALPGGHPARAIVRSPDFHSASGCRDLLFHVHELQFTLPQVAEMLRTVDMEFIGFEHALPAVAHAFSRRFPSARQDDLGAWDQFEREHPEVFGGMYQFWCRRPA